jgi:aryl-alcohol dehydrogenase-like predicted oxidoreductase
MISSTQLPRSGLSISRLGLGLSRLHHLGVEADRRRLIDVAHDLGITHFDAARLYGDGLAERSLGQTLGRKRPTVTIATKFGLLPNRLIEAIPAAALPLRAVRSVLRRSKLWHGPKRSWSVRTLHDSLASSLRLLRTDYVDILFVHDPRPDELATGDDLLRALVAEKQKGKVRFIGIAGHYDYAITIYSKYSDVFDVLQVPETEWKDGELIPDITFGALAPGPQIFGSASPDSDVVRSRLANAFARRPDGAVLVGTTNAAHLRQLAGVSR